MKPEGHGRLVAGQGVNASEENVAVDVGFRVRAPPIVAVQFVLDDEVEIGDGGVGVGQLPENLRRRRRIERLDFQVGSGGSDVGEETRGGIVADLGAEDWMCGLEFSDGVANN